MSNTKNEIPSIIFVTDSDIVYQEFKSVIHSEMKHLIIVRYTVNEATQLLTSFRLHNIKKQGFDVWVPAVSIKSCHRRFRKHLRKFAR